VIDKQFCS